MVITLPLLITLGGLLFLSAAISATEAAILSINKVRLRHQVEQGNRGAILVFRLLTQLDRVIGTLLLANNIVNVGLTAVASWICISILGSERGLAVATILVTIVIVLLGEVTPKTFAAAHPELIAYTFAAPLAVLMRILYPLSTFFTWAARGVLRLLRVPVRRRSPLVTEEEIKVMIQMGREAGVLAEDELRMLHRIFEFSDSHVEDAMVPKGQIVGLDLGATPDQALDVLIEEGHSRIPVYKGDLDHVVGVLYTRDVLAMARHRGLFVLSDLIRPVMVVPGTKRIAELLSEFQRDKIQIAVVQDGRGATIGLVTIEDLLEEIVGEIHEDVRGKPPRPQGGGNTT